MTPFDADETTSAGFSASRSWVDAGTRFESHLHQEDQLAWMRSGSVRLTTLGTEWHLRREHLAWVPAGVLHEMTFAEPGELLNVYTPPSLRPASPGWDGPRTLRADELTGALLAHMVDATAYRRLERCRTLLVDLLTEAPVERDVLAIPRDPRARRIAAALLHDPADARELRDWSHELDVNEKTIARAFVAGTGSTFRQWRVQARMHAAAGLMTAGHPVQDVAAQVGYRSVSSFIAAFKERYDVTPARYAARGE
ncbi:helix-turn-helix domain-containing protein [Agromyces sp. NPDC058110]|uniref:helix-turn-helix domain-containing protein n=1 Tax=Agromyces sp. NPDC058110 TaxID=3346345 RepID=UPI0036D98C11